MTWRNKIKDILIDKTREEKQEDKDTKSQDDENINKFLARKLVGLNKEEVGCFLTLFRKFAISSMEINLLDAKIASNKQTEKANKILSSEARDYIKDFIIKHSNNYTEDNFIKFKDFLETKSISFDDPNELRAIINIEIKEQSYSRFKNIMCAAVINKEFSEYLERFVEIYGLQIRVFDDYKKAFSILGTSSLSQEEKKDRINEKNIYFEHIVDMTSIYAEGLSSFVGDCIDKSLKISFLKKLLSENNIELGNIKREAISDEALIDLAISGADKRLKERQQFRSAREYIYFPSKIAKESGYLIPEFYREHYENIRNSQYSIYITHFIEKYGKDGESWSDEDINNLYNLLTEKGLSISIKELQAIVSLEYYEQSYKNFKKLFFTKPKDLNEALKMFAKGNKSELETIKSYRDLAQQFGLIWNEDPCARDLIINTQFKNENGEEFTVPYYGSIVISEHYFEQAFFHLKRYLSEQKIPLKDNDGNEINNEELLELIFDMVKTAELENFESQLIEEKEYSAESIDVMNGFEFESFLKLLFEKMGYKVTHTKLSGDQGADLVIDKCGESTVVQAKRYNSKVSNDAVQEVVASIKHYKAKRGMAITNSEFTNSAIELARSNNIILIDRKELKKLIDEYF